MKLKTNKSLTIIIAAAILLQMISAVQYYYTRSLLADELEKRAESEMTTRVVIVKNALNMAENSMNGHLWDVMQNITRPDSMYGVVEWVLRSHPNLLGCGVAFKPDFYPEKGKLYEPYIYRLNGQLVKKQLGGPAHDYTQMAFYQETMKNDAPCWSDAYYDSISGRNIVTYSRPVHDEKGETVAIFGLDIALDWLGDTLNYRHIYPSSYDILLSETGQLIAAPEGQEMERVVRMINDSTVGRKTSLSGRSRMIRVKDQDGDEGTVFHTFFKGKPHWQIAVVCYDKEVYGKLRNMRLYVGALMLLGLLVLALIIGRFAKNDRKLQKVKLEQERIGSELRVARHIQMEMLPTIPSDLGNLGFDLFGSLIPAREVGGDLFDFFIRDEKLFFTIGDVSGKGVPAAMVMAVIHSLFRMAAAHETNPARIMQTVNETACEGNESNMFVTLFLGILDLPTGRLHYCNAGHDKPLCLQFDNGQCTISELPAAANLPVGLFTDFQYETQEYLLEPMTTIFLYTDGLTEAKNTSRELFGLERVEEVLKAMHNVQSTMHIGQKEGKNSQEMVDQMTDAVHKFVQDAEQSDDLTMMAIRYIPKKEEDVLNETLTLKNDLSEVVTLSNFVKDVFGRLNLEPKLSKEIRLAVEEAVVNVIDYAYPAGTEGEVTVNVSSDGCQLKFVIIDAGIAFDPTGQGLADTTLTVEERPIGGLGIYLIRQLMDSINYERIDGKNILTIRKKVKLHN